MGANYRESPGKRCGKLFNIAIVDDEQNIIDSLKDMIEEYAKSHNIELSVESFLSGENFLTQDHISFSVIFLDIDMPVINGLNVAKKIRETNSSSIIIFCTNFEQYAINGYEVDAFGFLVKPVNEFAITKLLNRTFAKLGTCCTKKITVKTITGNEVFDISKIVFVEVQKHILYYYVYRNGKMDAIRSRGSMHEVVKSINSEQFVRCSVCYLVNLQFVLSIKNNFVNVPEHSLAISRNYKKPFLNAFMSYMNTHGVVMG